MDVPSWLLFVPQLPATPSSLRVLVWRRLRAAGALGLQNGVWALPQTPAHAQILRELLAHVARQGGTGLLFAATALDPAVTAELIARFRADRDQEYGEVCERCAALLTEIAKETRDEKFTFAELEETEHDLQKLTEWLGKIQTRDTFGGHQAAAALAALTGCRQAFQAFARAVYRSAGLDPDMGEAAVPDALAGLGDHASADAD